MRSRSIKKAFFFFFSFSTFKPFQMQRKRSRPNETEGDETKSTTQNFDEATVATSSSTPAVSAPNSSTNAPTTHHLAAPTSFPQSGAGDQDFAAFEHQHVHEVYDSIAAHFSSTRYKPWPLVRQFVDSLPVGSFLADVGCGNGKNLPRSEASPSSSTTTTTPSASSSLRSSLSTSSCVGIGCDYSAELLRFPAASGLEVLRGDGLCTPFRSDAFDAAISIAVIHHFATPERRMAAIRELLRIVRRGGQILIYVWAREQPKRRCPDGGNGDVMVPWEMHKKYDEKETKHARYYHFFEEGELEGLVTRLNEMSQQEVNEDDTEAKQCPPTSARKNKTATVVKSYYDKENWCIILQAD